MIPPPAPLPPPCMKCYKAYISSDICRVRVGGKKFNFFFNIFNTIYFFSFFFFFHSVTFNYLARVWTHRSKFQVHIGREIGVLFRGPVAWDETAAVVIEKQGEKTLPTMVQWCKWSEVKWFHFIICMYVCMYVSFM